MTSGTEVVGGESPPEGAAGGSAGALERVGELLKERERYDQWLDGLEARKANTPPHVYDRVRTDYQRRRNLVLGEIAGHAGELRAALSGARDRHAMLEQTEASRRDERAEAELRYEVGEYSEDQWRELSAVSDSELGTLAAERESARRELDRLEDVVRLATPAESSPAVAATPASEPTAASLQAAVPEHVSVTAETAIPVLDAASAEPADQPARATNEFDELAFLKSVVGRPSVPSGSVRAVSPTPAEDHGGAAQPPAAAAAPEAVPVAAAAPAAAPEPAPPPPAPPANDRPSRFSTPVGQIPLQPPTPRPTSGLRQMATPPRGSPSISMSEPSRRISRDTGKVPSFLKDVPVEQVKTLKCQECGTMNYPTEWYCERCGGELAAM